MVKAVDMLVEFYNPEGDKINQSELSDTRRPRLTLKHLNKLRKLRDLEREERKNHVQTVKTIYGSSEEGENSF